MCFSPPSGISGCIEEPMAQHQTDSGMKRLMSLVCLPHCLLLSLSPPLSSLPLLSLPLLSLILLLSFGIVMEEKGVIFLKSKTFIYFLEIIIPTFKAMIISILKFTQEKSSIIWLEDKYKYNKECAADVPQYPTLLLVLSHPIRTRVLLLKGSNIFHTCLF